MTSLIWLNAFSAIKAIWNVIDFGFSVIDKISEYADENEIKL